MKVLLVNKFWFIKGGAERVVFATKELLEKAGHTVEIFGMKHKDNLIENDYFIEEMDYQTKNIFKKIKFGFKALYNFEAKNKFAQLINNFQPEIIHLHNTYNQFSISILEVIKKSKIPAVMTLHDYKLISPNYNLFHHGKIAEECVGGKYYRCLFNNCKENWGQSLGATLEAYFSAGKYQKIINKFISPSKFLRDKFIASGYLPESIQIINNPFVKDASHSTTSGKYVLFAGRLTPEKGANLLLKVAAALPKIKFIIVGDGPMSKNLRQEKVKNNLTNVEFTGYQQGEELDNLYLNAEIVVAPSVWYENAPLSVLEAMSVGKIVLASEIGGIPEILPKEFLFRAGDVADMIEKIDFWHNKNKTEKIEAGERLLKIAEEKFTPEKYLKDLLSVYKEIKK